MWSSDSGRASIPCLTRQRSVGDYVVIDEQPDSLTRADPVFFPKGVVNGAFHKKTFAVSSTPPKSDSQPLIPLEDTAKRVPRAVWAATKLAKKKVNDQYGALHSYNLKQYESLGSNKYYLLIEINVPSVPFTYVLVCEGEATKVDSHDFLNKFNQPKAHQVTLLSLSTAHFQCWNTVTHAQPAPPDVNTATFLARHYVVAQHEEVSSYDLVAYKKISKENGYAKDFYLKMNIGSKCIFVKLSADHHGGADNVATAEYDFSPK